MAEAAAVGSQPRLTQVDTAMGAKTSTVPMVEPVMVASTLVRMLAARKAPSHTVSRADVAAVLIATVENMIDALQEGKQVDFGELGKFRLRILSEGTETMESFTAANITGVNIQFVPGEDLKNIFDGLTFQPVPTRKAQQAVLRAEKAGETIVDLSDPSEEEEEEETPGSV